MNLLVLRSSFQSDAFVKEEYVELLQAIQAQHPTQVVILGDEEAALQRWMEQPFIPDYVMIATGGVENLFKRILPVVVETKGNDATIQLVADGRNNSLAAALEILTHLGNEGLKGRIHHGSNEEILASMEETLEKPADNVLYGARIGLFGEPSDWLIASGVDRDYLLEHYGVTTVDVDLQRLIEGIKAIPQKEAVKVAQLIVKQSKDVKEPSCADMLEAAKAYLAIKRICEEERLDAMTIRCFDIVKCCGTTSCLALALLNDEGIVAGCEGDMQTLMSMLLAKRLCGEEAFMANPSKLTDSSTMLAHCTVPLNLCLETVVRSHFESSIGVAIQGLLPLTDYTIFKWGGAHLDRYYVAEAHALETPYSEHYCRTQITLDLNMKPYLLEHSIGNHHVIIRGRHKQEIELFFREGRS